MMSDGFDQIKDLVEAYYMGMYAGDGKLLRRVFDPATRIRGFFADRYVESDLDQFILRMTSCPSPQTLKQPHHLEVVDIRSDGGIGTAIVRDSLHGMTFVDHLSLLRDGDGWRVIGKSYMTPTPLPSRS
jgi:Putative lumazine-binding